MKTARTTQNDIWTEVEMDCFLALVEETLNEQRCIASLVEVNQMRRLTYQEILDLARTDLREAIREVRINFSLDPQNGDWVGLRAELEDRAHY